MLRGYNHGCKNGDGDNTNVNEYMTEKLGRGQSNDSNVVSVIL